MQFLVIGKDGTDKDAMSRTLAARQDHLALGDKMEASSERLYGCVILDDNGTMIGSMAVLDFPSEKELQEYLKKEPYIVGKVWQTIEVSQCNVKKPWKFNRPQSFFEERKLASVNRRG